MFKIYPFLREIMDERGVIFSLTLHPPGPEPIKKALAPRVVLVLKMENVALKDSFWTHQVK